MSETFCCETYCFKCEAENKTEDLEIRTRQENGKLWKSVQPFYPMLQ